MYICFAEYRIAEEHRERYLGLMAGLRASHPEMYMKERISPACLSRSGKPARRKRRTASGR
jgi:hypothetical protein